MIYLLNHPLACFLFDLDGTLVKTHIDFDLMRETVRRLADEAGADLSTETNTTILESAKKASDSLGPELGLKLWRKILNVLEDVEMQGCAHPEEIHGARELLTKLQSKGVKIGVVTRNCRRVSVGLAETFALPYDVLLTRDDVAKTKPDPMHLYDAMAKLSVSPEQTAMVGDHWLDIQAGKAAGCELTVGVLGARNESWFEKCRPNVLVEDLSEISAMLLSS